MVITGYLPCFHRGNGNLHYVEKILRITVTPDFCITYMIMNIYYPDEQVNFHIQSLINIMQEKTA